MSNFSTPMMQQYVAIKQQYADCLLLYRMGDFYELFLDDAQIGAKVLGITLTSRSKGKDGRIPMAGVPYHALDVYLPRLVQAGYKVAICEQLSEPNTKGLIERDVVRIVTPGTLMDERALPIKEHNYILAITTEKSVIAWSIVDLSTGTFQTNQQRYTDLDTTLQELCLQIRPAECILPRFLYDDSAVVKALRMQPGTNIFPFSRWQDYAKDASAILCSHFGVSTLHGFGITHMPLAVQTAAVLLSYCQETQRGKVSHLRSLTAVPTTGVMELDHATIVNLELFSTLRDRETRGSLISLLDQTQTAMGGRLLRQWLARPSTDRATIEARHDAVEFFVTHQRVCTKVRTLLGEIPDIERMLSRLSVGIGNARDIVNVGVALHNSQQAASLLPPDSPLLIQETTTHLGACIDPVTTLITTVFVPEPSLHLKEGGLIAQGVNPSLDALRTLLEDGESWLRQYEEQERRATGISSLKVRYNSVFGYYIDISNANTHLVPSTYHRKQTLVNGERYITPVLKDHEEAILRAKQEIGALEYSIYQETLQHLLSYTALIQQAATDIALLDCLSAFASIAHRNSYCRPQMTQDRGLTIIDGRHPVVEQLCDHGPFVPNSTHLDTNEQQLHMITGPNMAGKSVYIRQVALIVLLAQCGSYVPATAATVGIVDRIFVRSGASDVITAGLSTFMVEMVETAYILRHATQHSLIVMDEIGRGTSTYDGISLAWAIAEYLVTTPAVTAKTLFATHYHELQELACQYPAITNYHLRVTQHQGDPVFVHTITPGTSSGSFGIAVAKRAGVPQAVITRADQMLRQLTQMHAVQQAPDSIPSSIIQKLRSLDIAATTPLEALNILSSLAQEVG